MLKPFMLTQRQDLPLDGKILLTNQRIREWHQHNHGKTYVAFSGGKDSTVLLHLVRSLYPQTPAVFCDTGLEFPEVRNFALNTPNVTILKPTKNFKEIIDTYGYPIISKEVSQQIHEVRATKSEKLRHKRLYGAGNKYKSGKIPDKWQYLIDSPIKISHVCCNYMKKYPSKKYEKQTNRAPYIGTMTTDSQFRKQSYLRYGCNAFQISRPRSTPMAFWTQKDIHNYIALNNLEISPIYQMGYQHTGCVYCAFGVHLETPPNKFQTLKKTHPRLHSYCLNKLNLSTVLKAINVPY